MRINSSLPSRASLRRNRLTVQAAIAASLAPGRTGKVMLRLGDRPITPRRAASALMKGQEYDFILAIGDDWPDEDTFKAMPKNAFTIRVGYAYTQANYNIKSFKEVRNLLSELI